MPTTVAALRAAMAVAVMSMITACASTSPGDSHLATHQPQPQRASLAQVRVLDRVTWGASPSSAREIAAAGSHRYIEQQLLPARDAALPAEVQAQIDRLTLSQRPFDELMFVLERQRREAVATQEPNQRNLAQRAYQQELTRLAREAASRSLLRAIYSPNQLHEQMTWFWMNHFSVFQNKAAVRAMVGDYEEQAIRPHALGRFRALLGATARHPAMLRYLDNSQNAVNRINENYARELMELHTLGVGAGYTQHDVQELARILTGVGINLTPATPSVRADRQNHYVRSGVFEFNPNRHDYGDKIFLGEKVSGGGLSELDVALDRLARHPATARFVSTKLAIYFVADEPSAKLVERMVQTFRASDGDIAAVLRTLLQSPEFAGSLGRKFKDPMHYVVSALRLAYDERPISNTAPVIAWINRLGQGLYNRETPDGYALTQTGWVSPGQMTARFEVARAIGTGSAGLFGTEGARRAAAQPQLSQALNQAGLHKTLGPGTLKALDQATSQEEWNTFLLSSPEFMNR